MRSLVADTLERLRADLGALLGVEAEGVALTGSATAALLTLLSTWPLPEGAEVGVLPGEWTHVACRPARSRAPDASGLAPGSGPARRRCVGAVPGGRRAALGGRRAVARPPGHRRRRRRGVRTRRKWLKGTRGVGVLAVAAPWRDRLRPFRPAQLSDLPPVPLLEPEESPVAARLGFAHAVREHLETGPDRVRSGLAERGRVARAWLGAVPGWEVADAPGATSALVSLRPTAGQDVVAVREWLLGEHRILATACLPWRAPGDMRAPLLRFAPHIEVTDADLDRTASALRGMNRR